MPRAPVCFHVGSDTNRDTVLQHWGIYVFCTALWDLQNWWEGWLMAAQMINDSTRADKIWPAICLSSVQNVHRHTNAALLLLLSCTLLGKWKLFKRHNFIWSSLGLLVPQWKHLIIDYPLHNFSCPWGPSLSEQTFQDNIFWLEAHLTSQMKRGWVVMLHEEWATGLNYLLMDKLDYALPCRRG